MLSPLQALIARPRRFSFDAATRLLWLAAKHADPMEAIRFASPPALVHPTAEIKAAEPAGQAMRVSTSLIGLIGPSGTLPQWYTELVAQSVRARSPAVADFLDMLAQRLIGHFARAGAKYRLHRAAEIAHAAGPDSGDSFGMALLALSGFAGPEQIGRLPAGAAVIQHFSGIFSAWPRSADRLAALVSDWMGRPVELREFTGMWLPIPPDQRSALCRESLSGRGEAFNRLGRDCAAGIRAFDQQARFILRMGPLSRAEFEQLLPDRPALTRLVSMVRTYVGLETDFAVNLVLEAAEIPPLRLGGAAPSRLGWTSWLPAPDSAITGRKPADEAIFAASLVEARSARP